MATGTIHRNVSTAGGINSSLTPKSGVSLRTCTMQTTDDLVVVYLKFDLTAAKGNGDLIITGVPIPPITSTPGLCAKAGSCYSFSINTEGSVTVNEAAPIMSWYTPVFIYPRN